MMFSNLFLILPVISAAQYHEWLYCFFASGLFIFSPLFHWYRISDTSSIYFRVFKKADWIFAIGAFLYMYYYIYAFISGRQQLALFILLTLVVWFFWYGWRRGEYDTWHPWFHIVAPIVSSVILIVAN